MLRIKECLQKFLAWCTSSKTLKTWHLLCIIPLCIVLAVASWYFGVNSGLEIQKLEEPPAKVQESDPRLNMPELAQGDVTDVNGLVIPVVMGDRIKVDTVFPVADSEIILNIAQQISQNNFKVNYSDTHYVNAIAQYGGFVFLPSGEPEVPYVQLLLPSDVELMEVIPYTFSEVSDLVVADGVINFVANGMSFSGYYSEHETEDTAKWILISLAQLESPDELTKAWLDAMAKSLGPYYSREFARPVAIEGDVIDKTIVLDSQGMVLPAPRTGVDEILNNMTYATWHMSNTELYGNAVFVATTSEQDIYGTLEALDYVKMDIEAAFIDMTGEDAISYIITSRSTATWSNLDAYYVEGTLNGQRIISYVFYNPAKNNYSTLSVLNEGAATDVNCEKLLNAISERITFFKGAN